MAKGSYYGYPKRALLAVLCCPSTRCFTNHEMAIRRNLSARRSPVIRVEGATTSQNDSRNNRDESSEGSDFLTIAVIGGGWAGFTAADAISSVLASSSSSSSWSKNNSQVHLIDASPRGPGGLAGAGWTTPKLQQPVEAGIHGFWREYRNTFDQMEKIGLDLDHVLTPYLPSLLVSSEGKVAVAPVLGGGRADESSAQSTALSDSFVRQLFQALPPPLDLALLADYNNDDDNNKSSTRLSTLDRLSALGLLGVWADFQQEDPTSWERYDNISAEQLFRNIARVSDKVYSQLVEPLLHVLPMTTGYDCSAAAALSCFHVFALQSRGAFDVRWCRGSIAEKIFDPWVTRLTRQKRRNVKIRGSSKVTSIDYLKSTNRNKLAVTIERSDTGSKTIETLECDAVVLAIGATAAKRLIQSCPPIQALPGLSQKWKGLRGVTCVAVRLFLDRTKTPIRFQTALSNVPPVTVCGPKVGGIPLLTETGFCLYDLTRLQDAFAALGRARNIMVLEVDFFRADDIAAVSDDEEVVRLALQTMEASLLGPSRTAVSRTQSDFLLRNYMVLDFSVVRARNAVSHFCLGSAAASPAIRLGKGLYMCGDWIDREGHASWSTEKAVVTGRQAAASLAEDFGLECSCSTGIIPAPQDTTELRALRRLVSLWRNTTQVMSPPGQRLFPQPPWADLWC